MQTFFFNGNVIDNSFLHHAQKQIIQNLQIRRFIIPIKILPRPFNQYLYNCFNIIFQTLIQNDDAKGRWHIGGGINVPVNVTLKANKSQAKEIKRLLIQKKIQVVLTSMDDNNAEQPENKYCSMDDLLDFVLDPGVLHYCASR